VLKEEGVKITTDANGVRQGVGKLVLAGGGPGGVTVTLTLDTCCDPTRITFAVDLEPLKVVEVRVTAGQIAAAEVRVKALVAEARLQAAAAKYLEDPVLARAAPGHLFFDVPLAESSKKDPEGRARHCVIAVGPDGTLYPLFGPAGEKILAWCGATLPPAKDDPGIRAIVGVARRMAVAARPDLKFGDPKEVVITSAEGGKRRAVSHTPAKGPRGGPWDLELTLTFNKHGRVIAWWHFIRPAKQ
jgi:hypothetical protein